MLTIIFSWVVLFILISLVGRLFIKKVEWYEYFWIGLVAVFAILQIWSLFLPVNVYSLIFVAVLAGISAVVLFRKGIKLPKINFKFVVWAGLILFAISYFASLSGGWPDTYGYHLNAVKWSNLFKVVPGLANLHTRLGFNSSFFLFASMIDNFFLKDRSSHIALSLMASTLSIEFLWLFFKSKNRHLKIFILLSLPIFIEGIVRTAQVSSLSYDFALLIIILAICMELIKESKKSLIIAVVLCIMLVTVKLSGAVFSLIAILLTILVLVIRKQFLVKTIISFSLIGFTFIVPYIVRNIIFSGWPLYPLPLLKMNVTWAVPNWRILEVFEVIKAWAISPGSGWHTAVGLPFVQWFPGWLTRNAYSVELIIFFVAVLFLIISIFFGFFSKKMIKKRMGLLICGLSGLISIFYIIFSAPDLRFGAIFFWIFFASAGSLLFVELINKVPVLRKIVVALSVVLIVYVSWPPRLDSEIMLKSIRWEQSQASDQILITPRDGSDSFKVYYPDTDSCGNSNLPCTPETDNNFKEIVPGDISRGFAPIK